MERRQGTLISVGTGNEIEKGNRLLRFEKLNNELSLRITTGKREFIYAKVLRKFMGEYLLTIQNQGMEEQNLEKGYTTGTSRVYFQR